MWIRLSSILFSAATVPVVYLLGRQAVGRAAGLVGAAVVTLSPFAVYYGVEARPYATMAFFVALSTLALLKALDSRSLVWWLVYSLAAAGAAYTHYTSVFVLAVQAIWSLWVSRDRLRDPLLANLLIILLYLPWLPHVRGKQLLTFEHLEPLTAANMLKDLARIIPGYPYASLRGIPTLVGLAAIGICLLVGVAGAIWRYTRMRSAGREFTRLPLLIALAAATPVGVFLYSLVATDLWLARNLYASVPAAALVIAALLVRLPRPLAAVTVTVVLVTLLAGSIRAISPDYVRTPFRAMAAYLDAHAGPRDPVVNDTVYGGPPLTAQMKKPHLMRSALRHPGPRRRQPACVRRPRRPTGQDLAHRRRSGIASLPSGRAHSLSRGDPDRPLGVSPGSLVGLVHGHAPEALYRSRQRDDVPPE